MNQRTVSRHTGHASLVMAMLAATSVLACGPRAKPEASDVSAASGTPPSPEDAAQVAPSPVPATGDLKPAAGSPPNAASDADVVGAGEAPAAPAETPPAMAPAPEAVSTANPDAPAAADAAPGQKYDDEAVEREVRRRIVAYFRDDERPADEPLVVVSRGKVSAGSATFWFFSVVAPSDFGNTAHIAVATQGDEGLDVFQFDVGSTVMVPGSESSFDVVKAGPPSSDKGWVIFPFTVESTSADFATDGDCLQRAQAPSLSEDRLVVCGRGPECRVLEVAREVAEPGFEMDCKGKKSPSDDVATPYRTRLEVIDDRTVAVTRVSGTPPDGRVGKWTPDDDTTSLGEPGSSLTAD